MFARRHEESEKCCRVARYLITLPPLADTPRPQSVYGAHTGISLRVVRADRCNMTVRINDWLGGDQPVCSTTSGVLPATLITTAGTVPHIASVRKSVPLTTSKSSSRCCEFSCCSVASYRFSSSPGNGWRNIWMPFPATRWTTMPSPTILRAISDVQVLPLSAYWAGR